MVADAVRLRPVAVVGFHDAVQIDVGGNHTCAQASTGKLFCWGSNLFGELGDGGQGSRGVPISVPGFGILPPPVR